MKTLREFHRSSASAGATPARIVALLAVTIVAVAVFATIGSASSVTAAAAQYAPVNTGAPTISGSTIENQTLTANEGVWTGQPNAYAYQWLRCDAAGNACADIAGATAKTYKLQAADIAKTLRVRITASNNDGKTTVTSGQSAVIIGSGPAGAVKLPNGETSIPVSSVSIAAGQRLIVSDVTFTPNPAKVFSNAPILVRVKVKDTRGYVVRGSTVFVRTTPEVTSTPPEQLTASDGWVTLTMVPQVDFPKNPAYNVQVYVRARKAGEDPLGGVSTRRLVQFGLAR
ncbi:hypothetical protein [Gaiella sp.]|uniref:hypothetical protein n=1 Tax=Gaiella sp. TaxID=2663207 RepID=UPI003263719B